MYSWRLYGCCARERGRLSRRRWLGWLRHCKRCRRWYWSDLDLPALYRHISLFLSSLRRVRRILTRALCSLSSRYRSRPIRARHIHMHDRKIAVLIVRLALQLSRYRISNATIPVRTQLTITMRRNHVFYNAEGIRFRTRCTRFRGCIALR